MLQFVRGTVAGTGSAIDLSLGFVPEKFRIYNPLTSIALEWNRSMAAASGRKVGDKYLHQKLLKATRAAIGGTTTNVYNSAFDFAISGVHYTKAATAAGTAPAATTVPQNTWGLFGFELGTDGTIDNKDAADNATGYATEALAIAALPTQSSVHVLFMYITVMSVNAAGFIGATTALNHADVTCHYYNVLPWNLIATGGITELDDGTYQGVTIGTDSDINVSGETLIYEAIGVH